jgi:site-specific DNA-adenine methylase
MKKMINIEYIKSPLNWVGNKFKYLKTVNQLIQGKAYNKVIDCFMGSGN